MKIQPNSVVALTYDLFTREEDGEKFVERADQEHPLIFLYGIGMMLPKFEENLAGLSKDDAYDFHLKAEDAYGVKDPAAFAELPIDMFKDIDKPEIDSILPLQDNEGNQFRAKVTSVTDMAVIVDLNHPMAGQDLHFIGKIIAVRDATQEELAHGHAHGIDGHAGH